MIKKIILGLGAFISSSGAIFAGTHFSTLEKINSKVKVLPLLSVDRGWDKLFERIKEEDSSPKSDSFKKLKESFKENEVSAKEEMKKSCQSLSQQSYKSSFFENSDLFSDVKKFCSLNLSELMDENKIFNTEGIETMDQIKEDYYAKDALKTNFEEKAIPARLFENRNQITDRELLYVVNLEITFDDYWKELLLWCKKAYSSPYEGDDRESWKNIENFCQDKPETRALEEVQEVVK